MTQERREPPTDGHDDPELQALLRAAGPRPRPPAAVTDEVRTAVAAEWRAVVAARSPRRRTVRWLVAASVAAVAVGAWLALTLPVAPGPVLASIARLAGPAEVRREADASWENLPADSVLRAGDRVRTLANGRMSLRRSDGLEVRLDAATTLAFDDDDRARLETGRVYVDSGRSDVRTGAFVIETALGSVRHLGTQYAVNVAPAAVSVAVREGSVAIDRGRADAFANAGESLTMRADGRIERGSIAPHDAAWRWAEAAAPSFAVDGRTLDEFLEWAARETGRRLVYVSAEVARAAQQTVLKGSVDGLAPTQAIDAVLTTTPSLQARAVGAQLRIEPGPPIATSP